MDNLSKLADMLFQGSHSCYEFCEKFTDSFGIYLISPLILLPAFLAVNPYYLTLFLHFILPSQSCCCCFSPPITKTPFSIPVWLAHSPRYRSCVVCLLICVCKQALLIFYLNLHPRLMSLTILAEKITLWLTPGRHFVPRKCNKNLSLQSSLLFPFKTFLC